MLSGYRAIDLGLVIRSIGRERGNGPLIWLSKKLTRKASSASFVVSFVPNA
jgi:hypothetical protein